LGKGDLFKSTSGNENLHEISNDISLRAVNFTVAKDTIVKSTKFPHRNIHN